MNKLLFIAAIAFAAGGSGFFSGYGYARNQGPAGSGSGQAVQLGARSGFITTAPRGLGGGAGEEEKTGSVQPKKNTGPGVPSEQERSGIPAEAGGGAGSPQQEQTKAEQKEQEQYGVAPRFGEKREEGQGWVRFRKDGAHHTGWQRKHNVPKNTR